MKIELVHGISGSFLRDSGTGRGYDGLPSGAVVDIDAQLAERYVASGSAKLTDAPVTHKPQ